MTTSQPLPLDGKPAMRKSWFRKWAERELLTRPARIDALRPLLRFYQRGGLQKWTRKSGLLGKATLALLEAQLPPIGKSFAALGGADSGSWQAVYPSAGKPRGQVGLFLGCVARLTDVATLNAAIFVLNRLGYTVHVPPAQTCCGALHQHGGDLETAAQLSRRNIVAFNGLKLDSIISTASGCGVQLAEHVFLPSSSQPSATPYQIHSEPKGSVVESNPGNRLAGKFTARVMDISAFLAVAEGWDEVKLAPLPHEIMVHEPCSLRNVLRASAHSYALLARIPGALVAPLAGNDRCCGAAGTYFLDQPEMAKALRADKIAALLNASCARYLVTSNVGCAMYIGSGLREAGLEIEIVHPVTLVARQMGIQS